MNSITFVTTALNTKWLSYQQQLIKKHFSNATQIIVDGEKNYFWYKWLNVVDQVKTKWLVFVDEDFFFFDSKPLLDLISFLEDESFDIAGVSDGFHHYRQQNPVAMNAFFLVINNEMLKTIVKPPGLLDRFFVSRNVKKYFRTSLVTEFNVDWHKDDYPHTKHADAKFSKDNFEPYYPFFWTLLQNGFRFYYLYPFFDDKYKSTNPRIKEGGVDIGIHMWYTRKWDDSKFIVHGLANFQRYNLIEKYIVEHLLSRN